MEVCNVFSFDIPVLQGAVVRVFGSSCPRASFIDAQIRDSFEDATVSDIAYMKLPDFG